MKLKSKWGEMNADDGSKNVKLKLKTDLEREIEADRLKIQFHLVDVNTSYISKSFKDTLMPVESIRKDIKKLVFEHDAG